MIILKKNMARDGIIYPAGTKISLKPTIEELMIRNGNAEEFVKASPAPLVNLNAEPDEIIEPEIEEPQITAIKFFEELNADNSIKIVKESDSYHELTQMLEEETTNKKRKTVIEAIEQRLNKPKLAGDGE